jgi:two-component system sensor histidine kinase/response regulator
MQQSQSTPALPGTLLIVDDTPENLGFLVEFLASSHHRILVALDGEQALEQLQHITPDLVLLDVMMPGISGFETCRRLKQSPHTRDIPVIFMTALDEPRDKLEGFAAGAVDYVTKPLDPQEILARVGAQLTLRRLQQALEERNRDLQAFGHMVAHDLRNSLHGIISTSELLVAEMKRGGVLADPDDLSMILRAGIRMQETIDALLLLAGFEDGQVEIGPVDTAGMLARVFDELADVIQRRQASISLPDQWPTALGHEPWIERIWTNYIGNALKYGGNPPVLELGAGPGASPGRVCFWVRDNGPGVPDDSRELIFQPFIRLHPRQGDGHGLGLTIVRRIVHRLGGRAGMCPGPAGGSEFYFDLPGQPERVS